MISLRNIAISVFGAVITAAPTYSQDLSRYREFQLGTNLPAIAKQIRVKPSDAKAIHERPGEKMISDRSEKVIARWEDSQYSFNLFQFSSGATFGLVVYSKRLDDLAQAAIVESVRLDKQEAPQREINSRKKKDEANRAKQEKARGVNKPPFRP